MCWAPYTRTPPRTAPLFGYCPKGGTTTHRRQACANINVNIKHGKIRVGAELRPPGSHTWAPGFRSPTPTRQCLKDTWPSARGLRKLVPMRLCCRPRDAPKGPPVEATQRACRPYPTWPSARARRTGGGKVADRQWKTYEQQRCWTAKASPMRPCTLRRAPSAGSPRRRAHWAASGAHVQAAAMRSAGSHAVYKVYASAYY